MESYRYDTHVHTAETSSCASVPARKLTRLYREAGYDGIAITDHYTQSFFDAQGGKSWEEKIDIFLEGFKNALDEGRKVGLRVILGMELHFEENPNDYLVFGIDEGFLKEKEELYRLGLKSFRELIRGGEILVYQAHPFRKNMLPADPALLDGVEVFNGNPRHCSNNSLAYSYAEKNNLKMLSGSDFHRIEDLAKGGVVIPEAVATSKELVRVLNKNRCVGLIKTEDEA